MIKTRVAPEHNYKALFVNGKTLRLQIDPTKEITELKYPEFYDVAINNKCFGACSYCYVEAMHTGHNYEDIIEKIDAFFGVMDENQRPFQVAIGGAGEPTLHPQFKDVLKKFAELGILPNYTTNGMHLSQDVLDSTVEYSGGVAVTCHPHLEAHWRKAVHMLHDMTRLNLHIIISDRDSVDEFFKIYEEFKGLVEYFVLLPYQSVGRAEHIETAFDYLFEQLGEDLPKNIAFGALFYEHLVARPHLNISLYEPEIMSKYLDMDKMTLHPSSFNIDETINLGYIWDKDKEV
jgi:hypothetical protein